MTEAEIDVLAQIIWDYHHLNQQLQKCDAIFTPCVLDTRIAERAVELYKAGYGKYIIFSGGAGRLTKSRFGKPEAEVFADIARAAGVPESDLIVENKSSNTGENFRFTYDLLQTLSLKPTSLLVVQKPYMERRIYATLKKQWPDKMTEFIVSSPQVSYRDYLTPEHPRELVVGLMVGEVQRLVEYPKKGFQIEQDIPQKVWDAYQRLVAEGFTNHLIKEQGEVQG